MFDLRKTLRESERGESPGVHRLKSRRKFINRKLGWGVENCGIRETPNGPARALEKGFPPGVDERGMRIREQVKNTRYGDFNEKSARTS